MAAVELNEKAALHDHAERALALMRAQGFDEAQVGVSLRLQDELNIALDEPSLLRSTEVAKLSLLGLLDGRKASAELSDLADESIRARVASLYAEARAAPQDDANAVSAGQRASIVQGPQVADTNLLADSVAELLAFRARATPKMMIDEGYAAHTLARNHVLTSAGSVLDASVGWYSLSAFGTARDGAQSSSFNFAGGNCHDLRDAPAQAHFGIDEMLRDTERQIHTRQLDGNFVGDVVLMPSAVADLIEWLHGQISDMHLIAGSSLYRERVGSAVASPLLHLHSRFDAPGVAALSVDAFATPPVEILRAGTLMTLTPSLYASRKTGIAHVPVAASGWVLAAGDTARSELLAGVSQGALVGRLSMGSPAPNGDFSGVIKNSFVIADGVLGAALSEVMISGNVAQMLRDVRAVSRERIDCGNLLLPWLRIGNLHFS